MVSRVPRDGEENLSGGLLDTGPSLNGKVSLGASRSLSGSSWCGASSVGKSRDGESCTRLPCTSKRRRGPVPAARARADSSDAEDNRVVGKLEGRVNRQGMQRNDGASRFALDYGHNGRFAG